MSNLIVAISVLAIVVLGLAVMIGKVKPEDAFTRLGVFILILCLAPVIGGMLRASLTVVLKPALILLAVIVVVTVLVRALLTMKS